MAPCSFHRRRSSSAQQLPVEPHTRTTHATHTHTTRTPSAYTFHAYTFRSRLVPDDYRLMIDADMTPHSITRGPRQAGPCASSSPVTLMIAASPPPPWQGAPPDPAQGAAQRALAIPKPEAQRVALRMLMPPSSAVCAVPVWLLLVCLPERRSPPPRRQTSTACGQRLCGCGH